MLRHVGVGARVTEHEPRRGYQRGVGARLSADGAHAFVFWQGDAVLVADGRAGRWRLGRLGRRKQRVFVGIPPLEELEEEKAQGQDVVAVVQEEMGGGDEQATQGAKEATAPQRPKLGASGDLCLVNLSVNFFHR